MACRCEQPEIESKHGFNCKHRFGDRYHIEIKNDHIEFDAPMSVDNIAQYTDFVTKWHKRGQFSSCSSSIWALGDASFYQLDADMTLVCLFAIIGNTCMAIHLDGDQFVNELCKAILVLKKIAAGHVIGHGCAVCACNI